MGKPHISVRKHICWDPYNGGQPSEPTSTIVLTSARNFYVDVRMLKADDTGAQSTMHGGQNSFAGLDWAFAGTSSTLRSPIAGDTAEIMEWQHWIDSRHPKEESKDEVRDVGRCYQQKNGDTQELGSMVNPDTGVETEYEELWGSSAIESTEPDTTRKVAVVLQTVERPRDGTDTNVDTVADCKGLVIRVGQHIQGLAIHNGNATVERWTYNRDRKQWQKVVCLGSSELPCPRLFDPIRVAQGEKLSCGRVSWQVMEQFLWFD